MIIINKFYNDNNNQHCYNKIKTKEHIHKNKTKGQNKKKSKPITKANWDILLRRRELDDRERFRGAMSWSHSCKVNNLYFIVISL